MTEPSTPEEWEKFVQGCARDLRDVLRSSCVAIVVINPPWKVEGTRPLEPNEFTLVSAIAAGRSLDPRITANALIETGKDIAQNAARIDQGRGQLSAGPIVIVGGTENAS